MVVLGVPERGIALAKAKGRRVCNQPQMESFLHAARLPGARFSTSNLEPSSRRFPFLTTVSIVPGVLEPGITAR